MPNIKQQKKRVRTAADQRLENLRYRSTIKTLTKRLAAAVEEGDADDGRRRAPRARQAGSTAPSPAARCTGTPRARKKSQAARLASGAS